MAVGLNPARLERREKHFIAYTTVPGDLEHLPQDVIVRLGWN